MLSSHPSTLHHRVDSVGPLISARSYGTVTPISHNLGVCRQTLYQWAKRGRRAIAQLFQPTPLAPSHSSPRERPVLTLLVAGPCRRVGEVPQGWGGERGMG